MAAVTLLTYALLLFSSLLSVTSTPVVDETDQHYAKYSRSGLKALSLLPNLLNADTPTEVPLSFDSGILPEPRLGSNSVAMAISSKPASNDQATAIDSTFINDTDSTSGARGNCRRAETTTANDLDIITQRRIDYIMSYLIPQPGRLTLDPADISSW